MTSLERVLAALNGVQQQRPPFTLTLSLYGARLTGCPLEEYYSQPAHYVEGQQAVHDLCRPDILFGPFSLVSEAAAFGTQFHHVPKGPPIITKPAVGSSAEFLKLAEPDPDSHPQLVYIRESVRMLAAQYAGAVPVCGLVTAPVDLPALILGIDKWIDILVSKPDEARAILDITVRHCVSFANALLDAGAAFIAFPMMFTNPALLYKKLIDEVVLPAVESAFSEIKGPVIFHHGGNRLVPGVEDYLKLSNVAGFVIDHRDSLAEAREILGPDRLLLGNLNGISLSAGTTEVAVAKVNSILEDRKEDPRFIFATTASDVVWDTPPERIQAIADTIRSREESA
jgi:uroporphyrinogen decarboxylase